jgi:E3 ubiquitin-protein ligase UHRF1
MDQKLTAMNKALAKNCNAPIDDKNGAEATDWKRGKPVRVVRNHKGSKASRYCPKEGNRYDGIYKVAKYWPQKNKDGLLTWKYLLKRDDETPGPWTAEGKKLTKKLGLSMQYPDGYLEATVNSHSSDDDSVANNVNNKKRKSNGVSSLVIENAKQPRYELSKLQKGLIRSDTINTKLWTELLGFADSAGSVSFADNNTCTLLLHHQ